LEILGATRYPGALRSGPLKKAIFSNARPKLKVLYKEDSKGGVSDDTGQKGAKI
jgi:hypothetical protein